MVTISRLQDMLSHLRAGRKVKVDEMAKILAKFDEDIQSVERTLFLYGEWDSEERGTIPPWLSPTNSCL